MYENLTVKLESGINYANPVQRILAFKSATSLLEQIFPDLMQSRLGEHTYPQSSILSKADDNLRAAKWWAQKDAKPWIDDSRHALEGSDGKYRQNITITEVTGALETLVSAEYNPFSVFTGLSHIRSAISTAPLTQQREAYLNFQELIDTVAPRDPQIVYVLKGFGRLEPTKKRGEKKQRLTLPYQEFTSSQGIAYRFIKNDINLALQRLKEEEPSLATRPA